MCFNSEDVEKIYNKVKQMKQKGKNADYIPDLKKGNPNIYAISVCNMKGEVVNFGDYNYEVGIESVSKVFTLALALNIHGIKKLIHHIGKTKEKHEFNSIKDVVQLKNHTVNSFVNAGAMATTSLLYDETKSNESNEWEINKIILKNMEDFAGRKLKVNEKTYTKQCSVMVSSKDISIMAATLANNGVNPITHKKLISQDKTDYIIEHMSDHGLYNETPTWWEKTYFPAKSGVGGIIMIVIPGVMGIGIVSPPLNKYGNSYKGVETGKLLANIPIN